MEMEMLRMLSPFSFFSLSIVLKVKNSFYYYKRADLCNYKSKRD